jgi:glycosyltransferase involved in cell wall biosynthesis
MTDLKIEWEGEILSDIGYGIQARRIIKPLIEAGVDVKVIPKEDYVPDHRRIDDPYWLRLVEESKNKPDAPIRICYEIPQVSTYRQGAFNIAYAMWETDKYPKEWVDKINQANMFFSGCPELSQSAVKAGITVPVTPVIPPIDTDMWCPEGDTLAVQGIEDKDIVFMMNANWIPRKNFDDLLVG